MIDSHTHLFLCERRRGRAGRGGRARPGSSGCSTSASTRRPTPAAIAARRAPRGGLRRGRPPPQRGRPASTTRAAAEIARLGAHEKVRAIGETGLDYYRDTAAPGRPAPRLRGPDRDRPRARPADRDPRPRPRGRDRRRSTRSSPPSTPGPPATPVILHCFSAPQRVADAAERGWYCSFAGNVTYPSAEELREAAAQVPEELHPGRDRRSLPGAAADARQAATSPPTWSPPPRSSPRCAASPTRSWSARSRPTPARSSAGSRAMVRLGQNFLADPNLLDAIVRDAELGAGRRRARGRGRGRGADRAPGRRSPPTSTRSRSTAAWSRRWRRSPRCPTSSLHWGDAMKLDLAGFEPAPTAMVANLPYSVATPLILRTIEQLPSLRRWTVMVQREIADRLRAAPGSRTYGSPSVVAQLACEVELVRKVDPAVFKPRPRVESAILRLRRTGPGADPATRELVRAAFAHRRKSLARSLEHGRPGLAGAGAGGARRARPGRGRPRRGALARASSPPCPRSCRQTPEPPAAMLVHAPAKLNLCLYLGRAPRGRPARALLAVRAAGAGRPDRGRRGRARRGRLPRGRGREPGRAGAGGAARARLGAARRCGSRSRSGSRSPPASAAAAPTPPRSCASPPARSPTCRSSRPSSAPTCPRSCGRRWRWCGAPASGSSRCRRRRRTRSSCCPAAAASAPPTVFAEADRLGLGRERGGARRAGRARCATAAGAGASPLAYPELLVNDLEPAARSLRPDDRRRARRAARGRRPAGAPQRLRPDRGRPLRRPRRRPRRRRGARPRRRDRLRGRGGRREAAGRGARTATANGC